MLSLHIQSAGLPKCLFVSYCANMKTLIVLFIVLFTSEAHLYNPYYNLLRYNAPYYNNFGGYANQLPYYNPYAPPSYPYVQTHNFLPTLNILAEVPYSISNKFTVVPLLAMAQENMNMVKNGQIIGISNQRPIMTVKTPQNSILQTTPAVRIVLDQPLTVYSLKSTILFPSQIDIVHQRYKIPIKIGTVIAPIRSTTYVSVETPVEVNVLYAIPSSPIDISYVNNNDVIDVPDNQAVIVDSEPELPPKNVTIIDFPQQEASPAIQISEDDELGNRNPPVILAPAGIVQSTQPHYHVEPFKNPKESPVLIALREEAKRKRV